MTSPYIDTVLPTKVRVRAEQYNNNIELNIKNNLIDKVEDVCFSEYGYITKVYKIVKIGKNRLPPEDFTSSTEFPVEFACNLCRPLDKTQITVMVEKINKAFMRIKNGPISGVVTINNVNEEKFIVDSQRNIRYEKDNKVHTLSAGDFIKVNVIKVILADNDDKVFLTAKLHDMASDKEIKQFFDDLHTEETIDEEKLVQFDDYIDQGEQKEKEQDDKKEDTTKPKDNDQDTDT